jgi:hypothetical protein
MRDSILRRFLLPLIGGLLAIGAMTACDSLVGVNITEVTQLERWQKAVTKLIGEDALVYEIEFFAGDERVEDVLGTASVVYTLPDSSQDLRITMQLAGPKVIRDDPDSISRLPPVPLAALDLAAIPAVIGRGAAKLEAQKLEYAGVSSLTVIYGGEKPAYAFTLDGRPVGSGVTSKGRGAAIWYREVSFTVDAAGEMTMTVGDKLQKKRRGLVW